MADRRPGDDRHRDSDRDRRRGGGVGDHPPSRRDHRRQRSPTLLVSHASNDNMTLDDLLSLAHSLRTDTTQVAFHVLQTVTDSCSDGLVQAPGNDTIFTALINDQPYPVATTG